MKGNFENWHKVFLDFGCATIYLSIN